MNELNDNKRVSKKGNIKKLEGGMKNVSDDHKSGKISTVYKFNIDMTCGGCSGNVKRILTKDDKFQAGDIVCDLETKTVTVTTDKDNTDGAVVAEIIEALSEWSEVNEKTVEFVGATQPFDLAIF